MELSYKRLSSETWNDFEKLFLKHRGVRGGCWCTFYTCFSNEFDKMAKEDRRVYHKNLCFDGKADGVIVYCENQPVGWCQFGKPDIVKRFDRGRDYSKLAEEGLEQPDWRISCIFTDKNFRKQGIGHYAAEAALSCIENSGGGLVEVFPFDLTYKGITSMQHNGSVALFKEFGFKEISRLGKNTILMYKRV